MQYEIPDEDEDEDGLGAEPLDLAPDEDEDEAATASNGPEARRVAVLLELISSGPGLDAKLAQLRDEIDLDMLKVGEGIAEGSFARVDRYTYPYAEA